MFIYYESRISKIIQSLGIKKLKKKTINKMQFNKSFNGFLIKKKVYDMAGVRFVLIFFLFKDSKVLYILTKSNSRT